MRWSLPLLTTAAAIGCLGCLVAGATKRHWQTGTCTDAGLMRDLTVAQGTVGSRPFGAPSPANPPTVPEVATYVIETQDDRFEVKDFLPVGAGTLNLNIGDRVALAVTKKTVYIRDAKGHEYRFRLTKRTPRRTNRR
jgi:hypothetical protein